MVTLRENSSAMYSSCTHCYTSSGMIGKINVWRNISVNECLNVIVFLVTLFGCTFNFRLLYSNFLGNVDYGKKQI